MTRDCNDIITALPSRIRARLIGAGDYVPLKNLDVLCEQESPIRHVYFPVDSVVSLFAKSEESAGLEVGMIGCEGMLGVELVLGGNKHPLRGQVLVSGTALRLSVGTLRDELARSLPLRAILQKYVHVLLAQATTSIQCVRFHHIGPRLARWLLMAQDRAQRDHFQVSQEMLGHMLGVRRSGINEAAGELQRNALVAYSRGAMHVLDRAGLEAVACNCYAADKASYAGSFG